MKHYGKFIICSACLVLGLTGAIVLAPKYLSAGVQPEGSEAESVVAKSSPDVSIEDTFDLDEVKSVVDSDVEELSLAEDGEAEEYHLYEGDIIEEEHFSGAIWGEGYDALKEVLDLKYTPEESYILSEKEHLRYTLEMSGKPWDVFYNLNDTDELYRIDMTMSEIIDNGDQLQDYYIFAQGLLNSLYNRYGLVDGVKYYPKSTGDNVNEYQDLSTVDNLRLFSENDFLSVMYIHGDMTVWVVMVREDLEIGEDVAGTDVASAKRIGEQLILNKSKSKKTVGLPDVYGATNNEISVDVTEGIYSFYLGSLNTRFLPPERQDIEVIDETGDLPEPEVFDGSKIVPELAPSSSRPTPTEYVQ